MAVTALAALSFASLAAPAPDAADPRALDQIVVTATREEDAVGEVTATVTVIDREEIQRQLANDLRELFRYEPGVTVTDVGGRFGIGSISIRGIGGNRVALEVDGVPVPDAFSIGDYSNQGRAFVDVDTLKRVEIVRGPASSLYGSDAIGGIVAFLTKDPMDYLSAADDDLTLWTKLGYYGVDDGRRATATLAAGDASMSGLISASYRMGQSRDTQGETGGIGAARTLRDPTDYRDRSLLAKVVFGDDDVTTRITLDLLRGDSETDLLSAQGRQDLSDLFGFPYFVDVNALSGDDEIRRERASIDQEWQLASALADRARWQVYGQTSATEQRTYEQRDTISNGMERPVERRRLFDFDQHEFGGELVLSKTLEGNVSHRFTYGLELQTTRIEQLRDGTQTDLITGNTSNVVSPDVFPVRDFPTSDTLEAGLFVQDEIAFADGRFTLLPGLRVDHYDLDPRPDDTFREDNPGIEPEGITRTEASPKLGVRWQMTDTLALVAQYAHGFRAPPYNDVNLGFTNFQFGYTALPNPDLDPETSDGIEAGLRWQGDAGFVAFTAFRTRYDDFIESLAFQGIDPETGLMIFQSINRERVTIEGAELRAGVDFGAFADTLEGVSLNAAIAYADGEDDTTGQPLDSVDPLRAVLGIAWERGPWRAELVGTGVARQDDLPASETPVFEAPGYAVFDLLLGYQVAENSAFEIGVFNLADRTYWDWRNVRGRAPDSPSLLRWSEPGRTVSAQWRWQW